MLEMDVVERIKELCKSYSWTYYRLAKESGLTYSTLSTMLNKGNTPSIPTLMKICGGFGITMAQFFSEDAETAVMTPAQKQHLRCWEKLTDKNKESAEQYIRFLLAGQQSTTE